MSNRTTDILVFTGVYCLIAYWWEKIEVWLYGFAQQSAVDTFFGLLAALFITAALSAYRDGGGE